MKLLSISADSKTSKGEKLGYLTGIVYLAPVNLSGYQVCPMASKGCSAACLYSAGRGAFSNVQQARLKKTRFFFEDRKAFILQLTKEVKALKRKADRENMKAAVRLNGTSDLLPIEYIKLIESFPEISFYDYTKVHKRFEKKLPSNYYLTFSRSECNESEALKLLEKGFNVAVVFQQLPKTWKGYKVIDGDISDVRFLDPSAVVVGLKAKGKAKKDKSGFVINNS